jgi:hypothetical protein
VDGDALEERVLQLRVYRALFVHDFLIFRVVVPRLLATWITVTPGFKDKTECITICMPGSSSIHIVTSSVNNQQQYHENRIKRL